MAALLQVGLALVLIVSATAGEDKCRTGCHGATPNVFKFAVGSTYKYDFDGYVDLTLSSAEGQSSKTRVKATVLLTQQGDCNQVLRVQNLQVVSGDSKKYTNIADIEKPVVLNFHDGHVEDIICTEPSDTQNSLNIKRAIASMFQAPHDRSGNEIDVFGSCPTDLSQKKEGAFQVIRKTRNLNKCAHRESLREDFMATAFDFDSEIKSTPFFQGKYEAVLKLKNGIPQLITVEEDYLYVPFSRGDKGAKANVHSQLKFSATTKDNVNTHCNIPRSIIFEDPHPITSDKNAVGTILDAIRNAANAITVNVKADSASRFSSIIKLMRGASKKDLNAVYTQVRSGAGFTDKEIGKKVFLDALFRTSTGQAVEVGIDIYKSNGFDKDEKHLFFLSLNFVHHVTEGALSAAASLLSSDKLPTEAYLGAGALINRYCRYHSCDNVKGLNALLNALQAKLKSRPANGHDENLVLVVLKAIRNSDHVSNSLTGKIIEIAQDKQASTRLRAGALEAYKADTCNERFRDSAISIMKDIQLDSELRIKAYLALVDCANGKVATAVKTLIDDEPSVQVGGFIVSHLATLRSSTNPDKALAKAHLGGIRTTKKFPFDFRQYSFNGEYSYDVPSLGAAESVEGNVIYSQKSFLPRAVSLNLTTEVFGYRYNFLELEARQENLDKFLSSYIGPNGLFRSEEAQASIKKGSVKIQGLVDKVGNKIQAARPKREINKNQIEQFAKQITDKESPLNKDLHLDFSLKMFGTELAFLSLDDEITAEQGPVDLDEFAEKVEEAQEQAKDAQHSLTSNAVVLDSRLTYPTSIGFPLRLSVEATSSTRLETSSKITDNTAKFKFVPSINVEVAARLVVDAAVVESGLSVVGNLYSSIGGVAEVTWSGNEFMYKFSLPLDKQEILTVTHDILFETRELCGPETKTPLKFVQSKDFSVCVDQLKSYIGLTLCADINQPNVGDSNSNLLPAPLNGRSKFSLSILKNNFGYITFRHQDTPYGAVGSITAYDQQEKLISNLKYKLDSTPLVEVELSSSEVNGKFFAGLNQKDHDYYGMVFLGFNQMEYYVKLGFTLLESQRGAIYKPIMVYKAGQGEPQKLPYHIDGQIRREQVQGGPKFILDSVKLVTPNYSSTLTGHLIFAGTEINVDITATDSQHKGTLTGKLLFDDTQGNSKGFSINAHFTNNYNPNFNFDIKHSLAITDILNMKSSLQLIHGADLSSKTNIFKLTNSIEYDAKGEDSVFGTEHELSYPAAGVDNKFKLKTKKKSIDFEVRVGYKNIKLGTELEVEIDKQTKGDFEVDFELHGFDHHLDVELERVVSGYKSKVHHKITVDGFCVEVKGDVKHLFEQHRVDVSHDLDIKVSSWPDIKWKSHLRSSQNDLDTSIFIQSGKHVYMEAFLKAQNSGNVNGNIKLDHPKRMSASGSIKAVKGAGTGYFLVHFYDIDRKIKTEASFKVSEPTFNLDIVLYTNYEKDNNRKYRLITNNQYKADSLLDSKNTLDILGQKTIFNVKLSHKGDVTNFDDGLDTELILPTEQYFSGKFHRSLSFQNGAYSGQSYVTLEQRANKNAPGKTLTLKSVFKNTNPNKGIFDINYTLGMDDGSGHTLNGELSLKKNKDGSDVNHIDYNGKLYGSLLSETLQGNLIATYAGDSSDFKFSTGYGKGATLNVKGKFDLTDESGKPQAINLHVDVLTPNSVIRTIKYVFEINLPRTKKENWQGQGTTSLFVDDDGKEQGATLDIKYDFIFDYGATEGKSKDEVTIQNQDPFILLIEYKLDSDKELMGDVTLKYQKDKEIRVLSKIQSPNNETFLVSLQLETPLEKAKRVNFQGQLIEKDQSSKLDYSLTVNDLKYTGKVHVDLDEARPSCNLQLTYPTGKVDQFYGKVVRLDEKGFALENKIILHMYDFTLDSNLDVEVNDAEDFHLKVYFDSPKLKADKLSLTANTKDAHGSKKLVLNAKQGGANVLDGTMTYKIRKEGNKIMIDGSGQLTVNGEKKSGNFKVSYRDVEHGDGIELAINSIVGNKGFDIEYIVTENHFKYLTSYCVEKKDCAHVEVEWKDQNSVEITQVNIDLRPLGISHEFGLRSESDVGNFKYVVDVHLLKEQYKYQYNALVLPAESHFTLTTPNRIVSLESKADVDSKKDQVTGYVAFYFDKKNKPQEKTLLKYGMLVSKEHVSVEAELSAPPLKKPMGVSYRLVTLAEKNYDLKVVLDIIPNSDKKIIYSEATSLIPDKGVKTIGKWSLDLQPLHYKIEEEEHIHLNPEAYAADIKYSWTATYHGQPIGISYVGKFYPNIIHTKLVVYNKVIYEITAKPKYDKGVTILDTDVNVIGSDKFKSHLEVKNDNTLKFFAHKAATPNQKLLINSGLIPGSIADFRMEMQNQGKKIDLVHAYVKLDEADFGKSDYAVDKNNINQYLIDPARQLSQNTVKASTDHLTATFEQAKEEFKKTGDVMKSNKPNMTPILSYYEDQFKKLREELISDESLKQFSESIDNIISALATTTVEIISTISKTLEKLIAAIHQQTLNLAEMMEKDILPKIKEIITAVGEKTISLFQGVMDLCFGLLGQITSFFDAHQQELQQLAALFSQVTKDICSFVQKVTIQFGEILQTELGRIAHELKTLPVLTDIQQYISGIFTDTAATEADIAAFKAHMQELKSKISLPKCNQFLNLLEAYIEKKMRNQDCNDVEELTAIFNAGVDALEEVIDDMVDVDLEGLNVPIPSKALDTIPGAVLSRISFIRRLVNGDIPEWEQLQSFATFNPKQFFVPIRKYAIVVQGQHIFTFDNKHLTFPGKCSYLLARDVVNNEFSIVGFYTNGALSELTFVDKSDTITLKKSGAVSFNGAATEFPVRGTKTEAFRTYDQVHLKSKVGVNIYCQPDLSLCLFSVSGFYHAQLRGLLGNANAEPYDDYTTPKGVITASESDFGNSYKMHANCPAVKTTDHHTHHHAESCTKLFAELSELSTCFPFVNPTNFRQACDHGVAANIPNTESAIAHAYATACYSKFVPTFVPSEYLKCDKHDLYDMFSVKVPQNAADIVFAIDASTDNEQVYKELIQGLGNSLVKDLAERGIKDVEYHVLTFGGAHDEWPSHVTSNGGKMTFKGRMPNVKFSDPDDEEDVDFGHETLNFIFSMIVNYLHEIDLVLGLDPQSQAYLEATSYPFRPNAVKAIIAVTSAPCEKSEMFHSLQKFRATLVREPSIHLNLITPLGARCDFKVKDDKNTKNVIGFNDKGVFTFSDAKAKPAGKPDLLKDLSYDDFCSEYTAKSGGNVFVLDNFNKNKKLFSQVTSYNIAESLVSREQGFDCVCFRDGLFGAKNICQLVHQKPKPPTAKKLQKGR